MVPFATRIFLLLCCVGVSCYGGEQRVTVRAIEKLPEPLMIGDLERMFGPLKQGHGALSFYPCADRKDMDIRFWWRLTPRIAKSVEKSHSLRSVPIAFATLGPSLYPEKNRIIWPPSATHLDTGKALEALDKELKREFPPTRD